MGVEVYIIVGIIIVFFLLLLLLCRTTYYSRLAFRCHVRENVRVRAAFSIKQLPEEHAIQVERSNRHRW